MFIDDSTYQRGNKTYRRVLLRNSYRVNGKVRHDTIANLSGCTDEEINAIKFGIKNKSHIDELARIDQNISTEQGLAVGAVWALFQVAKQLGLCKILGHSRNALLSLWMILATLINQGSRLSAVRLAQSHAACDILGMDSFNEDDLYRAMDWLAENQSAVEDALFANRHGEVENLFLYDVTSSYLEGNENELAMFGYNRDGKKGKLQIVIGLLTDSSGRPVSVEVFKGNTQDPKTVVSQIKKLRERFGVKQVTLVGDRGMLKSAQIENLDEAGFHFITAITKPQIQSLVNNNVIQLSLFDKNVVEIQENDIRFVLRRNPVRADEMAATRHEKHQSLEDFATKQSAYLVKHPRANPEVALRKINEKAKQIGISNWISVDSHDRTVTVIADVEKRQEAARLDGCYVIKSDLPANAVSTDALHDRYKDLTKVEQAFRTMKTTLLEMRGIFVRKESRTRAHVSIIMLAYLIAYELHNRWYDVELTVEEGIAELASICSISIDVQNQARTQVIPKPRPMGQLLLKKLNISLPDAIPHRNIPVVTRKKLVSERKLKKFQSVKPV